MKEKNTRVLVCLVAVKTFKRHKKIFKIFEKKKYYKCTLMQFTLAVNKKIVCIFTINLKKETFSTYVFFLGKCRA